MLSRSGALLISLAQKAEGFLSWAFLMACQLLCGWSAHQSNRLRCTQSALCGSWLLNLLRHHCHLHLGVQPMAVKVLSFWLATLALFYWLPDTWYRLGLGTWPYSTFHTSTSSSSSPDAGAAWPPASSSASGLGLLELDYGSGQTCLKDVQWSFKSP